jgi:8-oxo-dGTP diphosphatase
VYVERVIARSVTEIDWLTWKPVDHATLLFVVRGGEVLLIRKKRGLGAGKINGPGGRIQANETPLQAAVREVVEEVCVTPFEIEERGELSFQFVDGYSIHVHVFIAAGCDGEPHETDEAIPLWTRIERIPYDEMWADDRLWVPILLAGKRFSGRFIFDGDAMLDHVLR